jgi:hypothetical protein
MEEMLFCLNIFLHSSELHFFVLKARFRIIGQGWARNFKNVAPQKQNTISKLRAQYAKHLCAFKLFKMHCAATINSKNTSFHKRFLKHDSGEFMSLQDSNSELQFTKPWT